jgi:hypothetical protein
MIYVKYFAYLFDHDLRLLIELCGSELIIFLIPIVGGGLRGVTNLAVT